ncbi:MAG: hypothetical protein DMG64_11170 [Acidobacteria bacterium]|nr:MAG: hypothetical protein DMG64_11170 [Acidobacteriota bacterium]
MGSNGPAIAEGVTDMAKLIEFRIPPSYKSRGHWVPERLRGRVLDFRTRADDLNRAFSQRVREVSTLSRTATP